MLQFEFRAIGYHWPCMDLKSIKYIVEKSLKNENYRKIQIRTIEIGLRLARRLCKEIYSSKAADSFMTSLFYDTTMPQVSTLEEAGLKT